jgi:spore coat protein U-like protein
MKLTTKKTVMLGLSLIGLGMSATNNAYAASTTGNAIQTVIAALSIANVSDLNFGSAPAGDVAKTVAPGASEDATNGSFTVTGQASTAYTITLPVDGVVTMITAGGGVDKTIAVDSFLSFPAAGANGLLSSTGSQSLFVGATRAALGATQVAGAYTGTYTVTVVY